MDWNAIEHPLSAWLDPFVVVDIGEDAAAFGSLIVNDEIERGLPLMSGLLRAVLAAGFSREVCNNLMPKGGNRARACSAVVLIAGLVLTAPNVGADTASTGRLYQMVSRAESAVGAGQAVEGAKWSIDRLMEAAVATSPGVLSKRAEVDSAKMSEEAARWQYFPTPSVNVQRFQDQVATTVSVRQPLLIDGKISADVDVASARVAVAEKSVAEVKLDIATRVVSGWGNVMSSYGRRRAQEAGVDRLRSLMAMMERRHAAEFSAKAEKDLVAARLDLAVSDLAQAAADERSSLEALSQLLGSPLRLEDLVPLENVAERTSRNTSNDYVELALQRNPTLHRIDAEIETAARQVDQARKSIWPTVYARWDVQRGEIAGGLLEGNRFYVGIEQSFGAGLSSIAQVDAVLAQQEAARKRLEAARRDISASTSADIEGYRAAVDYEKGVRSNLDAQSRVADSYQRMFLAGKRSWLDLLNMIREQSDAERLLAMARVRRVVMAYRLALDFGEYTWLQ